MVDEEFAYSNELDKSPRVLAFRKEGMKGNYWEAIKDDVSFRSRTALSLRLINTFYRMRNERYVQSVSSKTACSQSHMYRHFIGACLAKMR